MTNIHGTKKEVRKKLAQLGAGIHSHKRSAGVGFFADGRMLLVYRSGWPTEQYTIVDDEDDYRTAMPIDQDEPEPLKLVGDAIRFHLRMVEAHES